jgi:hypothetical protein
MTTSETGQLSLHRRPNPPGGWFVRCRDALKRPKLSCVTLYAMHLASGIPVDREPGICPVCGADQCKLARMLEARG